MKRKYIDNFLLELERFITENELDDDMIQYVFIPVFKANIKNMKNIQNKYSHIEIPKLVSHINKMYSKGKPRSDIYIRKIAYGLDYKVVNDFDYDNVFWKIVFQNTKEITPKEIIKNHNKKIQTELVIPADWFHTDDIYIY